MIHYLIEFRFFGKAKYEIKQLIREVDQRFHLRRGHKVPHISLAGPFETGDERRLISDFKRLCSNQDIMHFEVDGFDTFEDNKVVFIYIKPDIKLDEFRWQLSKKLQIYCYLKPHDLERKFEYHATIAMKLSPDKFKAIKCFINSKPQPKFKHILARITLIKNSLILCEYDFLLKRLLTRREAKSGEVLTQTFRKLDEYKDKANITDTNFKTIERIEELDLEKLQRGFLRKKKIFFISDTHFDHTNIIRYCNRPFNSTEEMNDAMLHNWNNTVKSRDIVFFLGDMTFGKGSRSADYWLDKLNGNIFFIRGFRHDKCTGKRVQHDRIYKKDSVFDNFILKYKDKIFFLTHDPANVPLDWKEWAICGHHHNNYPEEFPLINKKTKRINVSVELLGYKPIELNELLELIK